MAARIDSARRCRERVNRSNPNETLTNANYIWGKINIQNRFASKNGRNRCLWRGKDIRSRNNCSYRIVSLNLMKLCADRSCLFALVRSARSVCTAALGGSPRLAPFECGMSSGAAPRLRAELSQSLGHSFPPSAPSALNKNANALLCAFIHIYSIHIRVGAVGRRTHAARPCERY